MNPRILLPWIGLACLLVPAVGGTARMPELPLKTDLALSPDPLTQERYWALEPRELNPHRRFWFVEREVSLAGLRAVADSSKPTRYRVEAAGIQSASTIHLRAEGRGFSPFSQFDCAPEPNAWFATRSGSEVAARTAVAAWQETLDARRLRLSIEMERISALSEGEVIETASAVFRRWLNESEAEWWVKGRSRARTAEWRFYLQDAQAIGRCKPGQRAKDPVPAPAWSELMSVPAP